MNTPDVALVVVGAGRSVRFGSDKLRLRLGGRSLLALALESVRRPFSTAPCALVVRPEAMEEARREWEGRGVTVVAGGPRRQDSVRNGVDALSLADNVVVLIHDGARPFVPEADVRAVYAAAAEGGAAILVAPVVDTVKRLAAGGAIVGTVPREALARALTPQGFRVGLLRKAWERAGAGEMTDEAALLEAAGMGPVSSVPGDARNIKITTAGDVAAASSLFGGAVRTGQGLDVHAFAPGRPLWLCGVDVPSSVGLIGHSDADVALHAVTDALLGACGAGDIGQHFPPTDERWRGEPSSTFVCRAVEIAAELGFAVANCDVTLLLEAPSIGAFRDAMRDRLAELLGVPVERVNVKATTAEGLGFVGRQEGAVALAVVTLESAATLAGQSG